MDLFLKTFLSVLLYFLKMFISCRSVYICIKKIFQKVIFFSRQSLPRQMHVNADKILWLWFFSDNNWKFAVIFFHSFDSKFNFTLLICLTTILQYQYYSVIISFLHPKPIKLQSIHAYPALWLIFCKTLVKKIVY